MKSFVSRHAVELSVSLESRCLDKLCIPSCKYLLHLILLCCEIACCISCLKIKISTVQTSAVVRLQAAGGMLVVVSILTRKSMAETVEDNFVH